MCDASPRQLSSLPILLLYSSVLLGGVAAQQDDDSGGVVKDASISSLFSSSLSPEMGTAPPYEDGEPQVKNYIIKALNPRKVGQRKSILLFWLCGA